MSYYEAEILKILEENRLELKKYEKIIRRMSCENDRLSAELSIANGKIESLSASPPEITKYEEW